MTDDKDTDSGKFKGTERRKKIRRSGKQRRDQARWDVNNPIRRKGPGRRTLDRLLKERDTDR